MKRVTGIGGIFFKAKDAPALRAWYKQHLGVDVQAWGGAAFDWTDDAGKPVAGTTAWTNDSGWDSVFINWLKGSRLNDKDLVFVLSVGGGDLERNVSPNLVKALQHAKSVGATICGIVGRDGDYTAKVADACVIVPTVNFETITPHSEAFQAVIWHLLVSHPSLKAVGTKWESMR